VTPLDAGPEWHELGDSESLKSKPLRQVVIGKTKIALSYIDGQFGAVSGVCNHVGGPLGEGRCDEAGYIVCPWHNWKFHRVTGEGEPGYEADRVPRYELKEERGRLFVNLNAVTTRNKLPHDPHPLSRRLERAPGRVRLLGISTTAMDVANPRFSTSDALLEVALEHAAVSLDCDTQLIRVRDLTFRHCEGYYSKSASACTWPCSITQMDASDQMERVYEGIVFWADAVIVATPIRWGSASSLYFKMIERMNCIQNQITIRDSVLIRNKVASFIVTGGQDNIQAVAGQMLVFFTELGFDVPQFPFIAHSRGWSAEDMERNVAYVQRNTALRDGARALAERTVSCARESAGHAPVAKTERAGRKAHKMEIVEID
jgi:nitrite reductase/ring-hydroxylating ferredoxin subunit/multimeric flavodoxin WrbA